jgi:hypothetical protein
MPATYRLSRDVVVMFNGGGKASDGYEVRAAAGARLDQVFGGQGAMYAIPPSVCQVAPTVRGIFKHDSTYHYVWAPADAVEEVA